MLLHRTTSSRWSTSREHRWSTSRERRSVGSTFVALLGALPLVEVSGAEHVNIELVGGDWAPLKQLTDAEDSWRFAATILPDQLLGTHRIVAFAASVPRAEHEVSFVEAAHNTDYKQPLDPTRWLVESTQIDTVAFSDNADSTTTVEVPRGPERPKSPVTPTEHGPFPFGEQKTSLVALTTLRCSRFAAQRGISEGELVPIMTDALGVKVSEVWPILIAWVEGGMLDVLTDARWRAHVFRANTETRRAP